MIDLYGAESDPNYSTKMEVLKADYDMAFQLNFGIYLGQRDVPLHRDQVVLSKAQAKQLHALLGEVIYA